MAELWKESGGPPILPMKMKLRHSPLSPFVRKVLVLAHEAGLIDRIEIASTDVWSPDTDIAADNPLGKIPALITEHGLLADSTLICEYLDSLHAGRKFFPAQEPDPWQVRRLEALIDGLIDAAVARSTEYMRRPAQYRYQPYIERQEQKILRTLDVLEHEPLVFGEPLTIVGITMGCALGYLDFRLPGLDWRGGHPKLAAWFTTFSQRPSMQATRPSL